MRVSITRQSIDETLACLAGFFPNCFVAEAHRPHRPLKIGIGRDLKACCSLDRRQRQATLQFYVTRLNYLKACIAGAVRVDLDGNPAGLVTEAEAKFAAARHAEILAMLRAKKTGAPAPGPVKPPPQAALEITPTPTPSAPLPARRDGLADLRRAAALRRKVPA
jgi:sRNA-binding protein